MEEARYTKKGWSTQQRDLSALSEGVTKCRTTAYSTPAKSLRSFLLQDQTEFRTR